MSQLAFPPHRLCLCILIDMFFTGALRLPFPVVGGLLSAHLLSKKAGVELEAGWPCSGPLLRMAEEAARKLLPGENASGSCQELTGVSEDPALLTGVVPV